MKILKIYIILTFLFANNSYSIQLSGTYTIDPQLLASFTNFQNITSAITYITGSGTRSDGGPSNSSPFGVSGPVVFQIATGAYTITNTVNIPPIVGTSSINTIIFDGGNASNCTLSGNIDSFAILNLNQCSYVNLRNLTVNNYSSNQGSGIGITGNTSNNNATGSSIKNCIIKLPNSGNTITSSCIYAWQQEEAL